MPRHQRNRATTLASATLLALTLVGCGESDSGTPTDSPTSAATSAEGSPTGGSASSGASGDGADEGHSSTDRGAAPAADRTGSAAATQGGDRAAGDGTSGTSGGDGSGSAAATSSAGSPAPDPEPAVTPSADPTQEASSRTAGTSAADGSRAATSLSIPAVGLRTSISPQGLRGGKVNPRAGEVIWFTGNDRVRPGATGTSVIAGHVVNNDGPDEFAALEQLETGDGIVLTYPGGEKLRLEITSTDIVDKDELTTNQDVWGTNTDSRRVVLVTCDDELGFREDGHRTANFVAVAELPS